MKFTDLDAVNVLSKMLAQLKRLQRARGSRDPSYLKIVIKGESYDEIEEFHDPELMRAFRAFLKDQQTHTAARLAKLGVKDAT